MDETAKASGRGREGWGVGQAPCARDKIIDIPEYSAPGYTRSMRKQ